MKMRSSLWIAVIAVLILLGGIAAYKYYIDFYLPDKNIETAFVYQNEIIDRVKPDIKEVVSEFQSNRSESKIHAIKTLDNKLDLSEKQNGDTVGWLTVPDTNIDYPVMQCEDNDFYLHNGFDGKYNYELGCPFLDYRCEGDWSGFNSIVYAHNMSENRMCADIANYSDKSYFDEHRYGYLVLPGEVREVEFFCYLTVASNSAVYNTVFLNSQDCVDYIDLLFVMAKYTSLTEQELKERDNLHLMLLSTCTFEYNDARGVLVGAYYL